MAANDAAQQQRSVAYWAWKMLAMLTHKTSELTGHPDLWPPGVMAFQTSAVTAAAASATDNDDDDDDDDGVLRYSWCEQLVCWWHVIALWDVTTAVLQSDAEHFNTAFVIYFITLSFYLCLSVCLYVCVYVYKCVFVGPCCLSRLNVSPTVSFLQHNVTSALCTCSPWHQASLSVIRAVIGVHGGKELSAVPSCCIYYREQCNNYTTSDYYYYH